MPKEHHMPYRMKDQEMPKSLLKQPETHCNKRLPTALDVEGGMKREKKDLRARIIKHLRESPMTRKLKKNLITFPSNTLAMPNDVQPIPKRSPNPSYHTYNSHYCNNP